MRIYGPDEERDDGSGLAGCGCLLALLGCVLFWVVGLLLVSSFLFDAKGVDYLAALGLACLILGFVAYIISGATDR